MGVVPTIHLFTKGWPKVTGMRPTIPEGKKDAHKCKRSPRGYLCVFISFSLLPEREQGRREVRGEERK